ncbi:MULTISPECIES: TRAP transporter permease [Stutzerimonas]|jgi:TRAP transporter 4TM/12TM fusion protein|uniref:TRAP transporter 4TM/12TM fusion protein n=1 Tax=Stutzerimonas stutzeri TaxID=316 RepID=A0A5S5BC00_STUST|nr:MULTISPECIES: TRAP transporter permease [Stutzerimonas]MBU0813165.1 TRAP transporter permease [Gammaproteobacteria bacterium]HAW22694.1 C4-dicarboxylate ABC transporter [Pseudomonas sp.]MBK3849345.1 TRAP transporter fused permease subunit [Stutzerimonas xanthomarina]MBU0851731.1 TRAP transporter permease [Gammaproteobacteria bacterium]MBU1303663.1 TRAP transporter permease [Gammaproteobacteria bacterium]|tara:strand:+ start:727 stop:3279 length:2553 start_codon:yes stop_codon:yes gene_type:complete
MQDNQLSTEELIAKDVGARLPEGVMAKLIAGLALLWSLFQLWIASPLPFMLRTGVFNNTEARSIHLAFALLLAFLAYPAFKRSPRDRVPLIDIALGLIAAASAGYLFIAYEQLAQRPGNLTTMDLVTACIGIPLLLEATRRALGPALAVIALIFLGYSLAGPYMPGLLAHRGVSFTALANHQWITTEGVFGIALGVSTSFVFLFVLFGALLERAGAGHYFIQLAFSLLGHFRGGPAKAAVVASGMTGLISGSSIANVVTTGTFTIPMMKRTGFSAEKAGAVEVASSVNGQIMPPVMGAAAFLMVEYVGIPYVEVIKHAFLPALISYIALVYIVHLESLKLGLTALPRANVAKPWMQRLIGFAFGAALISGVSLAVYYGLGWLKPALGDAAIWVIGVLLAVVYVALLKVAASNPPLPAEDPDAPLEKLPQTRPVLLSGLHFLLPVVVLVWCLMVERLSPGLSAFWGSVMLVIILLTQRPLLSMLRKDGSHQHGTFMDGVVDLREGLIAGARNMIGIGIATAAAGIIVGAVSQTGVGLVLADLVELLSMGNLMLMLLLTAFLSLILGMGLPTTANYIVVSSLLAPVVVALGQQSGLIVPLIAVHLFVFYFGIMADVTPPVGLASFAAAAVSKGDPIKTGVVAFYYSLRTAALPFLFIFNTDLLLIDVDFWHGVVIFVIATLAMLIFAAGTQGYFLVRSRWYESILLLLIAFTLFRPGFWMDIVHDPYRDIPPSQLVQALEAVDEDGQLRLRIRGEDAVGDMREFSLLVAIPDGETGEQKLEKLGVMTYEEEGKVLIDSVTFGSPAADLGLQFDQEILAVRAPTDRLPKEWMWLPALLLFGLVVWMQRRRKLD